MKDIRELRATQIYLYPVGALPIEALAGPRGRQAVRDSFGFQDPVLTPWPSELGPLPEIRFMNGEFGDGKTRVVVPSLVFQQRRVVLTVLGTSTQADRFYGNLVNMLTVLAADRAEALSDVIYKAEETSCVVTLDIDLRKVLRPAVWNFLRRDVRQAASVPDIPVTIQPSGVTSNVTYQVRDQKIIDHGITLNPKEFSIQPRPGTPLAERTFMTKSPFRSDVHMELLEKLESLLK